MHEVSVQDKEKEHMTRMQDAVEMKVIRATVAVVLKSTVKQLYRQLHVINACVLVSRKLWSSRWKATERLTRSSSLASEMNLRRNRGVWMN